jgi:hypothetical protein
MSRYKFVVLASAVAALSLISILASAQNSRLALTYQPHLQTDSEHLQIFREPLPPTSYLNISGGDRGDPRLNVNRDVSVGGNLSAR